MASSKNRISNEEARALIAEYRRTDDYRVRNQLIERHLWAVHTIVNKMMPALPLCFDKDSLESWGLDGLLRAIEKFEFRKISFARFAFQVIRFAILDGVRGNNNKVIKAHNRTKKYRRIIQEMTEALGREPMYIEIAEHLGKTVVEVIALENDCAFIDSFFASRNGDNMVVVFDHRHPNPRFVHLRNGERVGDDAEFHDPFEAWPDQKAIEPIDQLIAKEDGVDFSNSDS